jgi:hypothetical protein
VTCADQHVTAIDLNNNNLDGSIPTDIGLLTGLTELALTNHPLLGGSIPTDIGLLTSLSVIALSTNNLDGSIPTEIVMLTGLGDLELNFNKLGGVVPSLPFAKIGYCSLDYPPGCTEPNCNHFKCPLPAGSDQCKAGPKGGTGVHCE